MTALLSVGALVYDIFPEFAKKCAGHIFLDGKIHSDSGCISRAYILYELPNYIEHVFIYGIWFLVDRKTHRKLAKILLVFVSYWTAQWFLYWYDRNTSVITNWVLLSAAIWVIVEILIPEKKTGKYVSFK